MTFLNPAILFGLAAASIPVILHFLNLRKLKKIEFSTLAFLKELQKTKIRRIKLKQLLLLVLRFLIIVLLVTAFARPTVKTELTGGSAVKTTAVFLIDNTFSMSLVESRGSLFNQAKQTAKNLLTNFSDGDEIAVIPFSKSGEIERRPKTNFSIVKKEIDELQISHASSTLNEAFLTAAEIIYASKNFNKEIYIFSDLQKGRLFNAQNELPDLSRVLDGNVRIYFFSPPESNPQNLGIDTFFVNDQIFGQGKKIGFTATVKNYSTLPVTNSVASLFINGKRSAQQSISIGPNAQTKLLFETTLSDTGLVEAIVELEEDNLIADNIRYTAFYVPEKIKLAIFYDRSEDLNFIRMVLADEIARVSEFPISQANSIDFKKYDALLLVCGETNADLSGTVEFYRGGGGVILMPSSKSRADYFGKIISLFDAGRVESGVGKINSRETTSEFGKTDFNHPLFADLFENKTKTAIESPEIYFYYKINAGTGGRTIIGMFDRSAFLSEYRNGPAKVLLFNTAPDLSWSTFPLKSIFPALIGRSVLYVSSGSKTNRLYTAGERIDAEIAGAPLKQIRLKRPSGSDEFINTDSIRTARYLSYGNTGEIGIYKFYSGQVLQDFAAVNYDPRESVLEKVDFSDLEEYFKSIGYTGTLSLIEPDDDYTRVIQQARFGTELWKYFLMAALLLALIEMFVAKSSKKDLSEL